MAGGKPPSDVLALLAGLDPAEQAGLSQRIMALPDGQLAEFTRALRHEMLRRCAGDGLLWLPFVRTRDEADATESTKPFPVEKAYIRAIWQVLAGPDKRIIVAKSRQMLLSWVLCAFAVWWARFRPNQHVVFQTQKEEDAYKLVATAGGKKAAFLGRCQFIERNLPHWMRQEIREEGGRLGYTLNGSLIEALPGGADQVRSKVPSLIIEDEFAYQSDAWGVYTAVNPLVQKGSKLILVSTPAGMEGNAFASLWFGKGKHDR